MRRFLGIGDDDAGPLARRSRSRPSQPSAGTPPESAQIAVRLTPAGPVLAAPTADDDRSGQATGGHGATETLVCRGDRTVYWPSQGWLLLADAHWGKDAAFRAGGIPVPGTLLSDELDQLDAALRDSGATRLVVLGDLIHDATAGSPEVVGTIARWRATHPDLDIALVHGNHDRHLPQLPAAWGIEPIGAEVSVEVEGGLVRLVHDPDLPTSPGGGDRDRDGNGGSSSSSPPARITLAGHIHPAVRLARGTEGIRMPCFWLRGQTLILPAFSGFTGGASIRPALSDSVLAVVQGQLLSIDPARLARPAAR